MLSCVEHEKFYASDTELQKFNSSTLSLDVLKVKKQL